MLPRWGQRWARLTAVAAIAAGILAAVGHTLGGVAGFWEFYRLLGGAQPSWMERDIAAGAATPSSVRPFHSLAVLPVKAHSATAADQERARALTMALTAAAGRVLFDGTVASYGLVQPYSETSRDLRDVGRELKVRYVIDADMERIDQDYKLTLELVDTVTGAQLWNHRQQLSAADSNDLINKFSDGVRRAIKANTQEYTSLPKQRRAAWEKFNRAEALGYSPADVERSRELDEEALRIDPTFVPALLDLAVVLNTQATYQPEKRQLLIQRVDDMSLRATELEPNNPRAWMLRATTLGREGNWSGAFAALDEAQRIDQYSTKALQYRAHLLIATGRPDEAVPLLSRALEQDPVDKGPIAYQCAAYMALGAGEKAVTVCETAAALMPGAFVEEMVAAAYANLGDLERAAAWKRKTLQVRPETSIALARRRAGTVSQHPAYLRQLEYFLAGLRKAGFPEN